MGISLDSIPLSAIVRIRDLMYKIDRPFRLDQGDVSFDAPDSFKQGVREALERNHTHYLPTIGVPRLRELLAEKLRQKNGIPVESADEVHVTNGGTHAIYVAMQALLEPGDEVIVPDPEWPPTMAIIRAAHAVPVAVPLHESLGWRWDLDSLERAITPKTRAMYLNSPNNPTGGMLTRADLERMAAIATERNLWVFSDEAYEDVVYRGTHISIASLPGMHARTISLYTFSKSYAVTGVRMGYYVIHDPEIRARALKMLMYTTSNVSSLVQYGAIGALEGPHDRRGDHRDELQARRGGAGLLRVEEGVQVAEAAIELLEVLRREPDVLEEGARVAGLVEPQAGELAGGGGGAEGAGRHREDGLRRGQVGVVHGRPPGAGEVGAEVVGDEVVDALRAPARGPRALGDHHAGGDELLEVAVERIGRPVELPGHVGDPAGGEHAHRLDDLRAHRREDHLPDGGIGDAVEGLARHAPSIGDDCRFVK